MCAQVRIDMDSPITRVLADLQLDDNAIERLIPLVYEELGRLAKLQLWSERDYLTLDSNDLVHEAFLRLFDGKIPVWNDRKHFFSTAAMSMRRILVDHARRKYAKKRVRPDITSTEKDPFGRESNFSFAHLLDLDACLEKLESLDRRQFQIVQLRFFAGLSCKETANTLGLSPRTVAREWWASKLWLSEQLDR